MFLPFGDELPVDLSLCALALSLALGWVLGTQIRCILVRYGRHFFFFMEGILRGQREVYNSAGWCGGEMVLGFKKLLGSEI